MSVPDHLWWKDVKICEDIKFAIHVFGMTRKASCDRGNSLETADRSQTAFIVWKLGAILSRRKMWQAVEGNFYDSKSE